MQVVADNLLVSYSKAGGGKKTVLCLHGWADTSETFKKLSDELKADYSIFSIDLPGFGGSQIPTDAWSIPDYSNFLKSFLIKLNLKPYAIIGHSNGSAIAIYAAANNLIETKKLVLLASSGVRSTGTAKKKFYKLLAKPAKLALSPLPKSVQKNIKKRAYQRLGSDLFAAEHMRDTFKNVINYDIQKDAEAVKIQSLLIYGERDLITPVEQGKMLAAKLHNSRLEVISGAAHFLHQEQPKAVAQMVKDFLK